MSWIIKRLALGGAAILAFLIFLPVLSDAAPVLPVVVKARLPHDPSAFTQGLLYSDGVFYESTGLYGRSSLRRVDPATGQVLARRELPRELFGEGLALSGGSLYQLTWREGRVLLADPSDLSSRGELALPTEGWGACGLDGRLVVSDGSDQLFFYDPKTMAALGSVAVTDDGRPVSRLNELETVAGRIWANVWGDTRIAVIDPATGQVAAWVDCSGLRPGTVAVDFENVLNGIAHDPATGRVWVTGKRWPEINEIAVPGLPTGGSPLSGLGGGAKP
ncbi:glutaminyl-peptide cyclotransferase [Solidesulfovibrio magneticus]|uniref:Glutamine cyclotransferase family protein n=1 Tax=Solidesulfovibrio magneticus (strain ATCC 700980 / DSM 13731 / RS-1) TaxID=573370 RepID=C4XU22_SOLM1|nr:glutaminyl-peptide cyclotransferase [Solidesulfovibrio magneticus]BAH76044.1 glutamine cyclotransferase family protein [Solidesulfovibrio magneticus RS-1]